MKHYVCLDCGQVETVSHFTEGVTHRHGKTLTFLKKCDTLKEAKNIEEKVNKNKINK